MKRLLALVVAAPLALVLTVATAATGPETPPYADAASAVAIAEIPAELLNVYRQAAAACPGLPWQIVAGVGYIESRHAGGRANPATGDVKPPIVGVALDGRDGRALIRDPGEPDGYARAHGPMQFLRTTFARWATLAPGRPAGTAPSPDNAWDAIHTAARKLCADAGPDADLADALFAYNRSQAYVEAVFARAAAYGLYAAPAADTTARVVAIRGATVPGSPDRIIAAGMSVLGVPYVWGGTSPVTGFDCSGLVQWAYAQAGIAVPRTTADQINIGIPVSINELAVGDLVFSRGGRQVHDLGHVGIYSGGGKILVAPRTGQDVSLRTLDAQRVQAVRRVLHVAPRA